MLNCACQRTRSRTRGGGVYVPTLELDFATNKTLDPRITFARASVATYYDGTTAKAEENLCLQSQTLTTSPWINVRVTGTANSVAAPDGTVTAEKFVETTDNNTHEALRRPSDTFTANQAYTFSIFAKPTETNPRNIIVLTAGGVSTHGARFNISTGAVDGSVGANVTADIKPAGSGWYRCSITWTYTVNTNSLLYVSLTDGTYTLTANQVYVGDGVSGIYLWGAQLEQRSSATAYVATTTAPITNTIPKLVSAASDVARFDHDPLTGASLGLLVEEQRTNLLTRSEEFDNAQSWTQTSVSVVANSTVAPDGSLTADSLIEASENSTHIIRRDVTFSAGTYTASIYAKMITSGSGRNLGILFNTTSVGALFSLVTGNVVSTIGSPVATPATPVGNGWWRFSVTATLAAITDNVRFYLGSGSVWTSSYSGDGTSGLYLWGAQLESGSFATSYIPTTSAQVTRPADSATMTGTNFSSWYRQDEGTLVANLTPRVLSVAAGVQANDASTGNAVRLALASTTDQSTVTTGGAAQATLDGGTPVAGTAAKVALAYRANDFALSLNAGTVATDTSGTLPTVSQFQIGAETTTFGNLTVAKIDYYPRRLSNQQLQLFTV